MRSTLVGVILSLTAAPLMADSVVIGNPQSVPCEDYYGMFCLPNDTYDGLVAWADLFGSVVSEGTKLCFTLNPILTGTTITEVGFLYFGVGDPGSQGFAGSGPLTVSSYAPIDCIPQCGTAGSGCSGCLGTTYAYATVSAGNHLLALPAAVNDLQAAVDGGAGCFCLCLAPGAAESYEVALSSMQLQIVYQPPTPTPTVTPTATSTPTPTLTPTVTPSPTPAPIPAASAAGLLVLSGFLSLLMIGRRFGRS